MNKLPRTSCLLGEASNIVNLLKPMRLLVVAHDYADFVWVPQSPRLILAHAFYSTLDADQRGDLTGMAGMIPVSISSGLAISDGILLTGRNGDDLTAVFFRAPQENEPVSDPVRFAGVLCAWLQYEPALYETVQGRRLTPAELIRRRLGP